jgi:hypothetical protein
MDKSYKKNKIHELIISNAKDFYELEYVGFPCHQITKKTNDGHWILVVAALKQKLFYYFNSFEDLELVESIEEVIKVTKRSL